jgi:hypothetical protein
MERVEYWGPTRTLEFPKAGVRAALDGSVCSRNNRSRCGRTSRPKPLGAKVHKHLDQSRRRRQGRLVFRQRRYAIRAKMRLRKNQRKFRRHHPDAIVVGVQTLAPFFLIGSIPTHLSRRDEAFARTCRQARRHFAEGGPILRARPSPDPVVSRKPDGVSCRAGGCRNAPRLVGRCRSTA